MNVVQILVGAASGAAEKVGEAVAMVNVRACGKRKGFGALKACLVIGLSMISFLFLFGFYLVKM